MLLTQIAWIVSESLLKLPNELSTIFRRVLRLLKIFFECIWCWLSCIISLRHESNHSFSIKCTRITVHQFCCNHLNDKKCQYCLGWNSFHYIATQPLLSSLVTAAIFTLLHQSHKNFEGAHSLEKLYESNRFSAGWESAAPLLTTILNCNLSSFNKWAHGFISNFFVTFFVIWWVFLPAIKSSFASSQSRSL